MNNLSQFLNFVAVAKHGSFADAARQSGLAPSSMAKSVARLEQELGIRLFHRTTRSMRLTEEGQRLFSKCSRLVEEIEALDLHNSSGDDSPSGLLCIGAPIGYGSRVMVPFLASLQQRYPALEIDLRLSDERINLIAEGVDAVIRFGTLDDSSMIARQFDSQPLLLCASPRYIAANPALSVPDDLKQHSAVTFRMPTSGRVRPLEFLHDGRAIDITPRTSFRINHGEALVKAALQGIGVIQVPEFMVRDQLGEGSLVELLPRYRPAPLSVTVIVPDAKWKSARVRVLIDALTTGAVVR